MKAHAHWVCSIVCRSGKCKEIWAMIMTDVWYVIVRLVVNYLKKINWDVAEVHRKFEKEAGWELSCLEKHKEELAELHIRGKKKDKLNWIILKWCQALEYGETFGLFEHQVMDKFILIFKGFDSSMLQIVYISKLDFIIWRKKNLTRNLILFTCFL